MRSALIVAAAQYFAVALGVYWGWTPILFHQNWLSPHGWIRAVRTLDLIYGLRASLPVPTVEGIQWIPVYHVEACLAALALATAGFRVLVTPQLRRTCRHRMWLCLLLFCYVAWLMYTEPFVVYGDDIGFVIGVMFLTPLLLAMSPLIRCREWLGLAGAVIFFATSLAMMIDAGCARGGLTGFFCAEVW
jgi:hypothetical protein